MLKTASLRSFDRCNLSLPAVNLDCFACFPETPHLLERGRADGVDRLYVECAERGELIQEPVEVEYPGCPLVVRRKGFFDGGDDAREFRVACLDGFVKPARSFLLRSDMSGARCGSEMKRLRRRSWQWRRRAKVEDQRKPFSHVVL